MTGKDLEKRLESKIDEVVTKIIFPNGKKVGSEWAVGGIDGRPGESLKVRMSGPRIGAWQEFGGGGTKEEKGDLIELWTQAKCDGNKGKAMGEIREYLGLPSYRTDDKFQAAEKKYDKPEKNWKGISKTVGEYLQRERKLSREVILESGVKSYRHRKLGPCYVFTYTYKGKVALAKYVAIQRRENGKKIEWTSTNSRPVLWGMDLPPIENNIVDDHAIIITEGEIDAMTLRHLGFYAVSVPFGAKNHQWLEHCYNWLSQFQTIYLCFDADEEGVAGAKILADRLGRDRVKNVELPEGKDPNSCDPVQLTECLAKAKHFQHERIVSAHEMMNRVMNYFHGGRPEAQGIPFMGWEGKDSVRFRLRPSEMTLHTGYPSGGKSTGLYQMIAHLSLIEDQVCAIASTEVDPEYIIYVMAQQALCSGLDKNEPADELALRKVCEKLLRNIYVYNFKGIANSKEIMDFFSYCCRVKGATHLILDSITNSEIDLEDASKVTEFLNRMVETTHITKAHTHLVAHLRKGDMKDISNIPRFDAVKGTNTFGALTFNCLTWWRNYLKEEKIQKCIREGDDEGRMDAERYFADTKLLISKQKIGGVLGEYNLWYDPESYSFARKHGDFEPMIQLTDKEEDEI